MRLRKILLALIIGLSFSSGFSAEALIRKASFREATIAESKLVSLKSSDQSLTNVKLSMSEEIMQNTDNDYILQIQASDIKADSRFDNHANLFISVFKVEDNNKIWLSNVTLRKLSDDISELAKLRIDSSLVSSETLLVFDLISFDGEYISSYQMKVAFPNDLNDTHIDDLTVFSEEELNDIYRRVFLVYDTYNHTEYRSGYLFISLPGTKQTIKNMSNLIEDLDVNSDVNSSDEFVPILDFEDIEDFEASCPELPPITSTIVGPPGPKGPTGAPGAAGAVGPAGDNSVIQGVHGKGAFSTTANITSNAQNNSYATSDFVFGSPQLDDDGDPNHDARFFFDKSKFAFRAGRATEDQWDDSNRGTGSVALGLNPQASGDYSTALGTSSAALGLLSAAIGPSARAEADYSIAIGQSAVASAVKSISIGDTSIASGVSSMSMGKWTSATGTGSYVIGRGNSAGDPLVNNIANSLAVAFNSNVPTLFIGPSAGINTTGNVGIGTNNPLAKMHIMGAMRLRPQASPPTSIGDGDLYYDDSNALCARIDGAWVVIAGAGACS